MARKALNLTYGLNATGEGTGLTGAPVETNAKKIDDTLAELDKNVVVVDLVANNTAKVKIAKPVARTLAGIRLKRHTALASAGGTILAHVLDGDGNTLMSTATIDAEALTASFVAQTLTATTANLDLAAGEPLEVRLVSNNADATGGPLVAELTWAAG